MSERMTSGTGEQAIKFWTWVSTKGLVKKPTADARRTALIEVLKATDNLETDVRELDIKHTLSTFENLRAGKYAPSSLAVYKTRFSSSILEYISWLEQPDGWRPSIKTRAPRSQNTNANVMPAKSSPVADNADEPQVVPVGTALETEQASTVVQSSTSGSRIIDYPFPVRDGVIAILSLPSDLTTEEANRLATFVKAVAVPDLAPF